MPATVPPCAEKSVESVSVVIPLLNEEESVDLLIDRLQEVARSLAFDFEFLFVDDGSSDTTLARLLARQEQDPRIVILELTRNWGHQNAFNAGLDNASGNLLILMDGDLEDPPELIPDLLAKWREGYQVVFTVKESRVQGGMRRFLTAVYYWLVRTTSSVQLVEQAGMFSLLDRHAARHLRAMKERNKSYPMLRSFIGYRQASIKYHRPQRARGRPRQTLKKLFSDGLNALFSFSLVPIRLFTVIGFGLTLIFALLSVIVLLVRITGVGFWIFYNVPGSAMAVILMLTIASFQITFTGILGEYIGRIYDEVRERPYYLVAAIHRRPSPSGKECSSSPPDPGLVTAALPPLQPPDPQGSSHV
ncbi:MAG: glycosyltransferase family 2 protein [Magnetococcales bacterium]|nr:glycosyltransferase family 2 protein [Magnetococcales bacterium]